MKTRDIILIIGGISFLLFVIFLSMLLSNKFSPKTCGCLNVVENNFVYIFIVLSSVFIGSLVYFLLSFKISYQKEAIRKNVGLVLSFLDKSEKEILNEIIENRGEILQSELTKKFGKLKTHRTIRNLESQKVINLIKEGKTNKIILKEELKKELVKWKVNKKQKFFVYARKE